MSKEKTYCLSCRGEGLIHTGINEAPTYLCTACEGSGYEAAPSVASTEPSDGLPAYAMIYSGARFWSEDQMRDAVLAERAACIALIRQQGISPRPIDDPDPDAEVINGYLACAVDAIRARN